ncbi:glycoside hydrolase family 43 protein [Pseudoruegeria sp. HB172150]|uniref:glycoside hydrolase family 43 protein n=1 Tax=Pseudoruegeria sp. HB172150 TaxID=2721164 RepID=UPI001556CE74|nr:glycoside hydrolase family 43 protein [Pseudoruegeria sp. HB172150]
MIRNPILPGFNPDPSICRVGEDYYIATSTFEWYPGVQIHHSRDLVNWTLVSRPLNRAALLDMRGNPDSCGIWAPCLSHADGKFWLVYTDVKRYDGSFKDAPNYITTCETIDGEWTDPWFIKNTGFDPSLFHDEDGKKYFMVLQWNHRGKGTGGNPKHASFDGILLQEWSPETGLSGQIRKIYDGTDRGLTEGPHIFKRGGWYYLTVAEGGTGYDHAVTMARSRDIWGPYETHPQKHLISTMHAPEHPIQRTGHGQYVETPDGQGYHTFLMGRPISGPDGTGRYCPRGRETGIERVLWRDDWLWLEDGGMLPREELPGLTDAEPEPPRSSDTDFSGRALPPEFQWLRTPETDRIFRIGDGALTLIARESPGSWFEQSLVARRQEHLRYAAETTVEFEPATYQANAGLTTYYNRFKFHSLLVTDDAEFGRVLVITSCPGNYPDGGIEMIGEPEPLQPGPVDLRVEVDGATQRFFYRQGGGNWQPLGPELNAAVISDEGGRGEHGSFTGAFVGMMAFDISGLAAEARFSRFGYYPVE